MNDHTQETNRLTYRSSEIGSQVNVKSLLDRVPIKTIAGLMVLAIWLTLTYTYTPELMSEIVPASLLVGGLLIIGGLDTFNE